jgi:thioredoxin reductase
MAGMSTPSIPVRPAYDVVVVGAGVAGLAAAAVLGRCHQQVLVAGGTGRANSSATEVHNLPYAEGVAPGRLYAAMEAELARAGIPVLREEVRRVGPGRTAAELTVHTGTTALTASRLLLATGARHELPGWVPAGAWGRSVFDCPFCHAYEHTGEDFAVVGKGVRAVETALLCVAGSRSMTVLVRDPAATTGSAAERLRGAGGGIAVDTVRDAALRPDGVVELRTAGDRQVRAGAVLLTGTLRPRADLAEQLCLRMESPGIPDLDADGRSSHPLVWVAGMAASPQQVLAESMAGGIRAGMAIHKDLALGAPAGGH